MRSTIKWADLFVSEPANIIKSFLDVRGKANMNATINVFGMSNNAYWQQKCEKDFPRTYRRLQQKMLVRPLPKSATTGLDVKDSAPSHAAKTAPEVKDRVPTDVANNTPKFQSKIDYQEVYFKLAQHDYREQHSSGEQGYEPKSLPKHVVRLLTLVKTTKADEAKMKINVLDEITQILEADLPKKIAEATNKIIHDKVMSQIDNCVIEEVLAESKLTGEMRTQVRALMWKCRYLSDPILDSFYKEELKKINIPQEAYTVIADYNKILQKISKFPADKKMALENLERSNFPEESKRAIKQWQRMEAWRGLHSYEPNRPIVDIYGTSALCWAYKNGRRDILDQFYQIQVDGMGGPSQSQCHSETLLPYALCTYQPLKEVAQLFDSLNLTSPSVTVFGRKTYWLNEACSEGHLEAAKYFVSKEAIPAGERARKYILFPVLQAAANGQMDVLQYLHRECKVSVTDRHPGFRGELTTLILATLNQHADVVKYILESFKDPVEKAKYLNVADSKGNTAIHYAIRNQDQETLKVLVDHGADPMLPGKEGRPAIATAARYGNTEHVELLEIIPSNSSLADRQKSIFLYAAVGGHIEIMQRQLDEGVPVDIQDQYQNGNTALHLALQNERLDAALYLLNDCKANPNILNNSGISPLFYMISRREFSNCDNDEQLAKYKQIIESLVSHEANVNLLVTDTSAQPSQQITILNYAIKRLDELRKQAVKNNREPKVFDSIVDLLRKSNEQRSTCRSIKP